MKIHLKAYEAVEIMTQAASSDVIMVQLPDGSQGVYQVDAAAVQATTQNSRPSGSIASANTGDEPTNPASGEAQENSSLPASVSLVADVTPRLLEMENVSHDSIEVESIPKGALINPMGIKGNYFIVAIRVRAITSDYQDPNWTNTRLDVTVAPHFSKHVQEVNGEGLIPIKCTDYNKEVADPAPTSLPPSGPSGRGDILSATNTFQSKPTDAGNSTTKPGETNLTIRDQLFLNPSTLDWSNYLYDDELLNQMQAVCDKDLSDDVLTALTFIRSKVPSSHFIIVNSKGVLIQTQMVRPRFLSFARIVQIKDLNPSDIMQETVRIGNYSSDGETENVLHIYPTLRKNVVQCYPSTPDAEKDQQMSSGMYRPKFTNAINITGLDETINERIAKAFGDVISHYGGQDDPALSQMITLDDLRQFIQDKINKRAFSNRENPIGPISLVIDEKAARLTISRQIDSMAGYKEQQIRIDLETLRPDDFKWTKSGVGSSNLTIVGKSIQFEYAGRTLTPKDSFDVECSNELDAQLVAQAFYSICIKFGWTPPKY